MAVKASVNNQNQTTVRVGQQNAIRVGSTSVSGKDTATTAVNVVGGKADVTQLEVSGLSTFTGIVTTVSDLYVGGDLYLTDDLVLDNISGTSLDISGISSVGFLTATDVYVTGITSVGTAITMYGSTGIVEATTFYGDGTNLTGIARTGSDITFANIDVSGITTTSILKVGTAITASGGIITATTFSGSGASLNSIPNSALVNNTVSYGGVTLALGDSDDTPAFDLSEAYLEWVLGASGIDHYTFTGPGLIGAVNDPTLYLKRGQKYRFNNSSGGHPFRIQTTFQDTNGTAYNNGITNNPADNGSTLLWSVQFDTPDVLYYQCTSHQNMSGKIYIDNVDPDYSTIGNLTVTGISTLGIASATSLYVSGISTFAGITTVTGDTLFTKQLSVSGITTTSTLKIGTGITASAGIITANSIDAAISEWVLGADSEFNHYTFTGPGLTGAENDPIIYLKRGQKYRFKNTMGAHGFRIQSTINGSTGTQYNDGITNNDVSNGTLIWDVQFDAPDVLYYQCVAHGSMGGKIYIGNSGDSSTIHNLSVTGISTFAGITTVSGDTLFTKQLSVSGLSTYIGIATYKNNVFIDGTLTAGAIDGGTY